jgi:hypothetical protein
LHPTGLAIVTLGVQYSKVSSISHDRNKREMGNSETNGLNSCFAVFNKHAEYVDHGSGFVIIIFQTIDHETSNK